MTLCSSVRNRLHSCEPHLNCGSLMGQHRGQHRKFLMLRCRFPIAVLLILTLPLQSFAGGSCRQRGGGSCCSQLKDSQLKDSQQMPASSCCSLEKSPAQPSECKQSSECKHCAATDQKDESKTSSADGCRCHCKKNPRDRPVTLHQRQLSIASILTPHDSLFVPVLSPVRTRPQIEVIDRSPGIRLHAVYTVWLN